MKVSTDACIQGAWTPLPPRCRRVLDVGAGTALLSLMLAQRAPDASVVGLENDPEAAEQAAENAASSPFASRVEIVQCNALEWQSDEAFDLVICNPPFFKNALKGPDARRNHARHIAAMHADNLVALSLARMSKDGLASFLWPADRHEEFAAEAANAGLMLHRKLEICHRPGAKVNRVVGLFGRAVPERVVTERLFILGDDEQYSPSFRCLMQPFYLAF